MKRLIILFWLLFLFGTGAWAQTMTREAYIERWRDAAIADMEKYGIPASIKMAQGLLESDNGNSRLATRANNHFGIKCKSDWRGATISHDDDAPGECFRSYVSAEDSWRDHSEFLDKGERYQFLFDLPATDYKAWAEGLKKAGYATNPRYPEMLVKIIEEHELYLLDTAAPTSIGLVVETPKPARRTPHPDVTAKGGIDIDNYVIEAKPERRKK